IYPVVALEDERYTVGLCDELGRPYAVIELS
ncbi:MAG: acyl-[acyl-carrier-protein] thioesterase, partial [Lachnospiraceae bacterium]|nr:acyl-[acyl-carrier-protein] thioesterase [Lachnospiraceae bacterium]